MSVTNIKFPYLFDPECKTTLSIVVLFYSKKSSAKIPTLHKHSTFGFVITIRDKSVSKSRRSAGVMSQYILGIDVGTTSIKAVLLEKVSRAVVASQTLATAADVVDNSGIKVSTLTRQKL